MSLTMFIILASTAFVVGQRPFYAGSRPIGYPDTPDKTTASLQDRFGEGTTERLPLEANGDRDLIDRISKLPVDQQPFWYLNWQALEAHRKNPQSYPQRPNVFIEPLQGTGNVQNSQISNMNGVELNESPETPVLPIKELTTTASGNDNSLAV